MLDELFTFPVVMLDADNEDRKERDKEKFGDLPNEEEEEEEPDMIFGEAEYPYWDFLGIEDRWMPSAKSFRLAIDGKFEACMVKFLHGGHHLVPWSKKKFKAEITKFQAQYEASHPPRQPEKQKPAIPVVTLTPEQYKKAMGDGDKSEE